MTSLRLQCHSSTIHHLPQPGARLNYLMGEPHGGTCNPSYEYDGMSVPTHPVTGCLYSILNMVRAAQASPTTVPVPTPTHSI